MKNIKTRLMRDRRGIGFGRMLAIIVLVLLGLCFWIMTTAVPKIEASIGTDQTNLIEETNQKIYFQDAIRLGFSKAMRALADNSFISKDNPDCLIHGASIILNENCKPETEYIRYTLPKETAKYVQEYIKKYFNEEIPVDCGIEQDLLTCETGEIELNSSKTGPYFSYSLEHNLKLKDSVSLTEKNIEEAKDIYEMAKTCTSSCTMGSEVWQLVTFEDQGDFFIFSLKTKNAYPKDDGYENIIWNFVIKK